jgi:hypothetical protein
MKPIILILLLFLSSLNLSLLAQEKQIVIPYTLADRDRAIGMDAKIVALDAKINSVEASLNARISSLETNMNLRFESIDKQFIYQQKQIDDIKTLFYWGFGIIITLIIFILGFIIWDRRTAMQPALAQASNAESNSSNLISTLKDYSKKHPDLAEILKTHGIL